MVMSHGSVRRRPCANCGVHGPHRRTSYTAGWTCCNCGRFVPDPEPDPLTFAVLVLLMLAAYAVYTVFGR